MARAHVTSADQVLVVVGLSLRRSAASSDPHSHFYLVTYLSGGKSVGGTCEPVASRAHFLLKFTGAGIPGATSRTRRVPSAAAPLWQIVSARNPFVAALLGTRGTVFALHQNEILRGRQDAHPPHAPRTKKCRAAFDTPIFSPPSLCSFIAHQYT